MVQACLSDIDLEIYHAGDFPQADSARWATHLADCDRCRSEYDRFLTDQDILARVRGAARAAGTEDPTTFLSGAAALNIIAAAPSDIRGYRIVGEIQRGAQGVVFRAHQLATRRDVALKVLLEDPFADPLRRRRRFEMEIELAGRLRHPNIVTIHDSGLLDNAFYYAMDLVEGPRFDTYLEEQRPTMAARMAVFEAVCAAVSYAHQRGVIHRDIKPSNIRIDADGQPRLLDFGLAKAPAEDIEQGITRTSEFMGTLAYASPEQVTQAPEQLDTRTDVYSLGVLLYTTLSGRHPYPIGGPLAEVTGHITQTIPPRLDGDVPEVDAELQAILTKTLAKDPAERYQSATELHADVIRYRAGEPVLARSRSVAADLARIIRRHRVAVMAVAAAIVIALSAGMWHVRTVVVERDRARDAARHMAETFHNTFAAAPADALAGNPMLRELLGQAARRVDRDFADYPEGEVAVRLTVGGTYRRIGDFEAARYHILKSRQVARDYLGTDDVLFAEALNEEALLRMDEGAIAEAVELQERALRIVEDDGEDDRLLAEHLSDLGTILHDGGDLTAAEEAKRDALALAETLNIPDCLAPVQENLAATLRSTAQFDEAEGLYEAALASYETHEDKAHLARCTSAYGNLLKDTGRYEEAQEAYRRALDLNIERWGKNSLPVARQLNDLGIVLALMGQYDEAAALQREALDLRRGVLGDHPRTAESLEALGDTLAAQGHNGEAIDLQFGALEVFTSVYGPDHDDVIRTQVNLANAYFGVRDYAGAIPYYEKSLEQLRALHAGEHPDIAQVLNNLGVALLQNNDIARARELLDEALAMRRRLLGDDHPEVAETVLNAASAARRAKDYGDAEALYLEALERIRTHYDEAHPREGDILTNLGLVYVKLNRTADAEAHYLDAIRVYEKTLAPDSPKVARACENLATMLRRAGRHDEAAEQYGRALAIDNDTPNADPVRMAWMHSELGECLTALAEYTAAEVNLQQAYTFFNEHDDFGPTHHGTQRAVKRLILMYDASAQPEEAAAYRELLLD